VREIDVLDELLELDALVVDVVAGPAVEM